jgi:hypothetical protein
MPLQFKTMNYFRAPGLFHMVRGFWFPVSGGFGNLLSIALTRAPVRYITLGFRKPAETGNLDVGHRPMSAYVAAMSETNLTVEKQRPAHLFKPGQSGNPRGRPVGARSRLSSSFIADLHTVWEETGIEALRTCAAEKPNEFCRIVALLMPRDVNLSIGTYS